MSLLALLQKLRLVPRHPDAMGDEAAELFADSEGVIRTVLEHFPELQSVRSEAAKFTAEEAAAAATRRQWQNYVGTQVAQPFQICRPASLSELKDVMREAAELKCAVRAVGSGHSWSDVALTDGMLIETHAMANTLDLHAETLRDPADAASLVAVEAGITIKELNALLDGRGLALINMGGYDGQTIAGVISTSTHGSGLSLGSLSSFVEALIVVVADGEVLQIEKAQGISDPAKFSATYGGERQLRQDDRLFNAAVVGVGCVGVIYAVILRVTAKYWLTETRNLLPWGEVKKLLQAGDVLRDYRHVEVLLNPYKVGSDNDHQCLLTKRWMDSQPDVPSSPKPFRDVFAEFLAALPGADRVLAFLFNEFPSLSPLLLKKALADLEDNNPYTDVSYRLLNVGAVNGYRAVSAEFGIDMEVQLEAMDALLAAAEQYAAEGAYHSSLIAMRWVASSPGFLSLQPRPTCMVEIPMLLDVFGADEMLWRHEKLLISRFKARPHWGQRNFLTGSHDMIRQLYPSFDEWLTVFGWFNRDGRFSSRFTDRVGISSHAPRP
jgi:L-gulono-1,4-lactone dehydrogenase